jgi:transposase InsO family protein
MSERGGGRIKKTTSSDFANIYYDPKHPAGYGSISKLQRATGASYKSTKKWLEGELPYVRHRPVRKKFDEDTIIVQGFDGQHEADLADMQKYSGMNRDIRFLLCIVDSLSKFAWVVELPDKQASTVASAIQRVYRKSRRVPKTFRTDRGTEFLGQPCQKALTELGIRHFKADNKTKAAIAERFIRTLKEKIWKHFTATGRKRYVDVLQDLVEAYNHTVHTTTGFRPVDVTAYNGEQVWRRLYGHLLKAKPGKKTPLRVGQRVLIAKETGPYQKGYEGAWSSEMFEIADARKGPLGNFRYMLKDLEGEVVYGTFKRTEVQPVMPRKRVLHKVERKKKTSDGLVPVQWRGYGKLVEWIKDA